MKRILWTLTAITLGCIPLFAQQGGRAPRQPEKKPLWNVRWSIEAGLEFNDNVFALNQTQENRLEAGLPEDQVSGRFENMESPWDLILHPDLQVRFKGPGFGGRKIRLAAGLAPEIHTRNPERTFVRLAFSARQDVGPGDLRFEFEWIPERFVKNYLADATDPTGQVDPDERVYEPGRYSQWELKARYRIRLRDGGRRKGVEIHADLHAGFLVRSYDPPFGGRNRRMPWIGVGFDFDFTKDVELKVGYTFGDSTSPIRNEVLILDEPDFGVDFNGDGDTLDPDRRALVSVDRSRRIHEIEGRLTLDVSRRTSLRAWAGISFRDYRSREPFDVAHLDREDTRLTAGAGVFIVLAKDLEGGLTLERVAQETNRGGDPGAAGEVTDFERFVATIRVSYRW